MEKEIRKILFEYIFYAVLFSAVIILIGVPTVFGDPHGNEGKQALFLVYFIEVIYLVSTSIIFLLSLLRSIQNIYSNKNSFKIIFFFPLVVLLGFTIYLISLALTQEISSDFSLIFFVPLPFSVIWTLAYYKLKKTLKNQ